MSSENNTEELARVFRNIDDSAEEMLSFLGDLIREPAMGPGSGGEGELAKARILESHLRDFGFQIIQWYNAPDERVPSSIRPNIKAMLKGTNSGPETTEAGISPGRIIIITHIDIVPPGPPDQWDFDPYRIVVKDGKAIGRGVEDNGQSLTASIFAAKALMDLNIQPPRDIVLIFVSDEEETNEKGIQFILDQGLIESGDLIIVADHGEPEGRLIDVTEKTIIWIRVTVLGQQCHASLPHLGKNAFRASMLFGSRVDQLLHEKFSTEDPRFDHRFSSFEPTKREPDQSGINVLPGETTFYFDCRLLPAHSPREVMEVMNTVARDVEKETGTTITLEPVLEETTDHPTPEDAPIVRMLSRAILQASGKTAITGGISGGTCAAILRNAGHEVAVWETIDNTAHSPNEYIRIDNLINDCKVFATLFLQEL
jgi:succinyl-diaminopimelate desuccinylase